MSSLEIAINTMIVAVKESEYAAEYSFKVDVLNRVKQVVAADAKRFEENKIEKSQFDGNKSIIMHGAQTIYNSIIRDDAEKFFNKMLNKLD
jgi:hypothetical protein